MQSAEITHATLLVLDDCNTLTFAAAVDPLRAANRQAGRRLYDWSFATPEARDVALTSGVVIPAAPISDVTRSDLVIVVAGFGLEAQSTARLSASLRRLAAQGAVLGGIDGGPWVLARAGVLNGHRATTHWEDLDRFATAFPEISVVNARFQVSGARMTSAGAAPALEMMLDLIARQHGAALAGRIATTFIFDPAPPRPQSRAQDPRHSPLTQRAQQLMEAHLDAPLPIRDLAARLAVSPRALQLQFRGRLNTTAQRHYLALRLAEAERLVKRGDLPLQEVALACGFGTQAGFARAFRAAFGLSASEMRAQARAG